MDNFLHALSWTACSCVTSCLLNDLMLRNGFQDKELGLSLFAQTSMDAYDGFMTDIDRRKDNIS